MEEYFSIGLGFELIIFCPSVIIFLPSNGWFNVVNKYDTQPNPQISALKSYF